MESVTCKRTTTDFGVPYLTEPNWADVLTEGQRVYIGHFWDHARKPARKYRITYRTAKDAWDGQAVRVCCAEKSGSSVTYHFEDDPKDVAILNTRPQAAPTSR
jgi:hypothetical protein